MKNKPIRGQVYIYFIILLGVIILVARIPQIGTTQWADLIVLVILGGLALIFNIRGATQNTHYNISLLVFSFTLFHLGIPEVVLVVAMAHLIEWPFSKWPWFVQLFNIGQYVFTICIAGQVFTAINPTGSFSTLSGVVAIMLSLAAFILLNSLLVGGVIYLTSGNGLKKSSVFNFLPLMLDYTLLCMGAAAAILWTVHPVSVLLLLVSLYILYSVLRVPALERESTMDPKTGVYNAKYLVNHLEEELSRANRFQRPITIVMADLDLLRNINNTYGHLAGDVVLKGVADILRENIREYDIVARFGGEEFAILFPETTPEIAYSRIDQIRKIIAEAEFEVSTSPTPIGVTLSFGIAGREDGSTTSKDLIHHADVALYKAKRGGRNKVEIFSDQETELADAYVQQGLVLELEDRLTSYVQTDKPPREEVSTPPAVDQPAISESSTNEEGKSARRIELGYILGVAVLSAIAWVFSFSSGTTIDWPTLFLLVGIVFFTELLSIDIYIRDTSVSTTAAPLLAGTLLFGSYGILILGASFTLAAWIKHRGPLNRILFNASNQILAGSLIIALLKYTQQGILFSNIFMLIVISMLASMILFIITTGLISVGVSLTKETSIFNHWRDQFFWLLPFFLSFGMIAFAIVYSYTEIGIIGMLVFLVPLAILRIGQAQYIERTKSTMNDLQAANQRMNQFSAGVTNLNNELMLALATVIDFKNPYVLGHSRQVSFFATQIARELNLSQHRVERIQKAGLLHDIGKVGIPEEIVNKPSALSQEEFDQIKDHVGLGIQMLSDLPSLGDLVPVVSAHHERFDGAGYPQGLQGDDIPFEARILAVAEAVDAMNSDRPYRQALGWEQIKAELEQGAGSQFDPYAVEIFIKLLDQSGGGILQGPAGEENVE